VSPADNRDIRLVQRLRARSRGPRFAAHLRDLRRGAYGCRMRSFFR
jgi:hypothetical protein